MNARALLFALMLFGLVLSGCGPLLEMPSGTPAAGMAPTSYAPNGQTVRTVSTVTLGPTVTASPTRTATPDIYAGLYPKQTQVELERININQEQLKIDQQQAWLDMQIKSDGATSTAGAQATGTAVANALGTSAAWTQVANVNQTGTANADATGTSIPLTQTPLAMTQQVESTQLAIKKVTMITTPVLVSLVLMVLAVIGILYLRKRLAADVLHKSKMEPDKQGRYPVVPEDVIPGKSKKLVNPNLAHRAVLDPKAADDLTTEQALANTQANRHLEAVRNVSNSPILTSRIGQRMIQPQPNPTPAEQPTAASDPLLAPVNLPDWRLLNQWDGKLLPYGVDREQKLLTVDPAKRPHLMVVGTTGTGKTRYEMRTIVAGALATGSQVIVIGKQADYIPFEEHPNVTLIPANAIKEPEKYIRVLKAASEEMFARDAMLVSRKVSTWDRYGGTQTMIVVDDYTAAMYMMSRSNSQEVLRWVLALAMDGRKYGLNLLLGLQRATWTAISTDLRSQMGRIALRVQDARESRIALDDEGAESLPDRHFLARLEDGAGLIRGVAFAMSDAETFAFLSSRTVPTVEKPKWIEGVARPVETAQPAGAESAWKNKAIDAYLQYVERGEKVNWTAIQRAAWGSDDKPGGAHFNQVKQTIAEFEGVSVDELAEIDARRATTTGGLADSGPVTA